MSPILGIWASSRYTQADTGAMFPLQVITVGAAGASSVTFTNIPSTYSHLQIRYWAYTNRTDNNLDDFNIRLGNGSIDTGSNYANHSIYGNGSTVSTAANDSASSIYSPICVGGSQYDYTKNGTGIIDILDYANANKYKTVRVLAGCDFNGQVNINNPGRVGMTSGLWMSASAVTNFRMYASNSNWAQYSQFALYGVKGA